MLLLAAETGLDVDSKAQAEQVRAVAVERVGKRLGTVPAHLMFALDEALRLHLALWVVAFGGGNRLSWATAGVGRRPELGPAR